MNQHVVIIGGGLAGLSAGCYARASGFRTTIVEHNLALGGVCTAWRRGPYLVDGCIHWLTGGPFMQVYEELGIAQRIELTTLRDFATLRNVKDGTTLALTSDLGEVAWAMGGIAPEDKEEIARLIDGAQRIAELRPPLDKPQDLYTLRDGARMLWEMRHELRAVRHFNKPIGEYLDRHLKNERLRALLGSYLPPTAPVMFFLMVLGYLSRGWLSRPVGGTAAFRDALIDSYESLGGAVQVHATVDEILVDEGKARGVRLHDGTIIDADLVISTSSVPETVLRLLGGRYEAEATQKRMREWTMFTPLVVATYGVERPLTGQPAMLILSGIEPILVGDTRNNRLYLRIYNDDPAYAPPGHAVVQAMLETSYDWWARCGTRYSSEKDAIGERALGAINTYLPGVQASRRMTDIATPLTYWNMARSWRGAYEGWMPSHESMFAHVHKRAAGLERFYFAGQWVEPGGGVPTACRSGREAVQLLCADLDRPFVTPVSRAV